MLYVYTYTACLYSNVKVFKAEKNYLVSSKGKLLGWNISSKSIILTLNSRFLFSSNRANIPAHISRIFEPELDIQHWNNRLFLLEYSKSNSSNILARINRIF
jgi:hypothetical protein